MLLIFPVLFTISLDTILVLDLHIAFDSKETILKGVIRQGR